MIAGLAVVLCSCTPQANDDVGILDGFDCRTGKEGWIRAKAVTPDVVPPCDTGSGGVCEPGYEYVSGTGWCRPK